MNINHFKEQFEQTYVYWYFRKQLILEAKMYLGILQKFLVFLKKPSRTMMYFNNSSNQQKLFFFCIVLNIFKRIFLRQYGITQIDYYSHYNKYALHEPLMHLLCIFLIA